MDTIYEPKGLKFIDKNMGEMLLVAEGEQFAGWLCTRINGRWVTLRKATEADHRKLSNCLLARCPER